MKSKDDLSEEIRLMLAAADQALEETRQYLKSKGIVLDIPDWVTIKEYCQRFEIDNTEIVVSWIDKGIVPSENVRVVEELNNIRLIRAVPYQVR